MKFLITRTSQGGWQGSYSEKPISNDKLYLVELTSHLGSNTGDTKQKGWMLEIPSLEDLLEFISQEVECEVIVTPPDPESETIDGQGFWTIEIYDENRE